MKVDVTSRVGWAGWVTSPGGIFEYGLIQIWKARAPHPSPPPQLLRVDLTSREGISFQIKRGVFEYRLIQVWEANFPHHSPEILKNQEDAFSNHKY